MIIRQDKFKTDKLGKIGYYDLIYNNLLNKPH